MQISLKINLSAVLLLTALLGAALPACARQPRYPAPPVKDGEVVIEISGLPLSVPVFYTHRYKSKKINFFLIRMDEKVLSFLDACVTCYPHKRGYRYEDGTVVCQACNQRFAVGTLEKGLGNCYPIKFDGRMRGNNYVIPLSLLESMADKF